jgi:predicted Zn-dependent peptidase
MEFKKQTLDNGLDVIGELNPSAKSVAVGFFVKTGSRDETEQINGVSHFLEHMLFKGTDKYSATAVNEAFDKLGAEYNAGTSWENTIFHAAVLPEYAVEVTKIWIELMRPALRDDDFNMEKQVIKEEIAMYKDTPAFDVLDRCRKLHFGTHPCGNSILGTEQGIDGLTAEQMREYFTRRYGPNNLLFACAGNFDWQAICAALEKTCSTWQRQPAGREVQPCRGSKKKERIEKSNLTYEHLCLMSPAVPAQDERRFAAYLLATIVGDTVGSRYYWELIDNALAETASLQFGPMDGTGVFCTYIRCSTANVPKVLDTVTSIFAGLAEGGVKEDELQKAKNKTLSTLVIENELSHGRLMRLGANWQYLQQYRTVEDDIDSINAVTIEDIHSLITEFDLGDFTQFAIGPEKAN